MDPIKQTHWLDDWHVKSAISRDYDVVDGIRGIAILLVIACHTFYFNSKSGPLTRFFGEVLGAGAYGVTIFFGLSGFLISHPFWRRKLQDLPSVLPPGYAQRRWWKIYPPLALSALFLIPFYLLQTHESVFILIAAKWLVGWPLISSIDGRFNPAMWSLVVEVQFYVLLPLVFLLLRRFSARACLWLVPLIFLVFPCAVRWWNISRGISVSLLPEIELRFPSTLDSFSLGIFLAGVDNFGLLKRHWARAGDVGLLLVILGLPSVAWLRLHPIAQAPLQEEAFGWMFKIAAALLICLVADASHPRARWLSHPVLRWCGFISYEWYLFHQPFTEWVRMGMGPAGGNLQQYLLIVASSLVPGLLLAVVVYRCFSLPILRYGRNRHVPGNRAIVSSQS